MMAARFCQLAIGDFWSTAEFRLDIVTGCYYAIFDFHISWTAGPNRDFILVYFCCGNCGAVYTRRVINAFMQRAIQLSIENVRTAQGGPFGAVIMRAGEIIAEGVNCVTSTNDPTAHAEVVAIRDACRKLQVFELKGCEIYASCEPCPMCLGAIYWARLERVYFGNTSADASKAGFDDSLIYLEIPRPHSQRKIPMIQLMRDEALEAFRAWAQQPNNLRY